METKDVHKGLTCEQAEIALGVKISSLEVSVSQQTIKIRKLEKISTLYEEIVNDWLNEKDITEVDWQAIKDSVLGVDKY